VSGLLRRGFRGTGVRRRADRNVGVAFDAAGLRVRGRHAGLVAVAVRMCGAVPGYPPGARARDPTPKWADFGPPADAPSRTSAHRVCEQRELRRSGGNIVSGPTGHHRMSRRRWASGPTRGTRSPSRSSNPFLYRKRAAARWRHRTSASGSRMLIRSAASVPTGGHGPRPASASTPSWGSLQPGRPDQLASWFGMRDEARTRIRSRRRRRRQGHWGVDTEWAGSVTR
jgi:hypothetical protein